MGTSKKQAKTTAKSREKIEKDSVQFILSKKAQQANQRLVRLEKAGIKNTAYSFAEKYKYKGSSKVRFRESTSKLSEAQAMQELVYVERFLGMMTSGAKQAIKSENLRLKKSKETLLNITNDILEEKGKKKVENLSESQWNSFMDYFNIDGQIKSYLASMFRDSEQVIETIYSKDSRDKNYLLTTLAKKTIKMNDKDGFTEEEAKNYVTGTGEEVEAGKSYIIAKTVSQAQKLNKLLGAEYAVALKPKQNKGKSKKDLQKQTQDILGLYK